MKVLVDTGAIRSADFLVGDARVQELKWGNGSSRITTQTLSILGIFLARPGEKIAGADIANRTGVKSGTLSPALFRLERAEWLQSKWEEGVPKDMGRPRRTYVYARRGTGTPDLFKGIQDDWGYRVAKHIAVLGVIATLLRKHRPKAALTLWVVAEIVGSAEIYFCKKSTREF